MSARPDVPRLTDEELDLLVSRSLDGDLSPEEVQHLERLVALDPAAARRRDELAALVADVKALPEPATPFALATRVNGNVAERGGRPGSAVARFGFFPAPGFAKAALLVLAFVGIAIAILRPAPRRAVEGPVDVLLYNPPPAASAPQSVIAEAKPDARPEAKLQARLDERARRQGADEQGNEAPSEKESVGRKNGDKKTVAKVEQAPAYAPASAESSSVLADAAPKQKADPEQGAVLGKAVVREEPQKLAAAAPAPPAAPAPAGERAMKASAPARNASAPARGWTVSVRGDGARRWALRRAPDSYPAPASGQPAVYRVSLDPSGRVASARLVGPGAADRGLDDFVKGMVFEPLPQTAGGVRDKLEKDAPVAAATEIEIELAPR